MTDMEDQSLDAAFACALVVILIFMLCCFIVSGDYDRGVRDHATGKAAYTEVTLPNGKTEWFVTRSDD